MRVFKPTTILVVLLIFVLSAVPVNYPVQGISKSENAAGNSISGKVTDQNGDPLPGVSIMAVPDTNVNATAPRPVLLVTGWGGSEGKQYSSEDENLRYIGQDLQSHGYIEGYNLFYASGTTPKKSISENAVVIRDEICKAQAIYRQKYQGRIPIFNIIGHSYGGLRARGYLESNLYGADCPESTGGTYPVKVDNLITLGTPHAGEWGDLPLASVLGIMGGIDFKNNYKAIGELAPPVREWENKRVSQPFGVDYYLLGGDARSQATNFSSVFRFMYDKWFPTTKESGSDMAVHQSGAHGLIMFPDKYPNLFLINTTDIHGRCDDSNPISVGGLGCMALGINNLKSYMDPSTTFETQVWPILQASNAGLPYIPPPPWQQQLLQLNPSSTDQVNTQKEQLVTVGGMPVVEIRSGELTESNSASGTFTVSASGTSQVHLSWTEESIVLTLTDPDGHTVTSSDSGVTILTTTMGVGWLTIFHFDNITPGIWSYQVKGENLSQTIPYRMFLVPSTNISVAASLPEWKENAAAVPLTTTVLANGTTTLTGLAVNARVIRPDSSEETITLLDDGNHGDGAANDGTYGVSYTNTSIGGSYAVLFTANGTYNSENFIRNASGVFFIAPASASLGTNYSDQGIDTNQDGLFDWLEISIPVTVVTTGKFSISAELFTGTTFIGLANMTADWSPGARTANLRFRGEDIHATKENGAYTLRNVMLLDETQTTNLIQTADPQYLTASYQYNQFYTPKQVYIPMVVRNQTTLSLQRPAADQTILQTASYSTLTDVNGNYTLSGLPAGNYTLKAVLKGSLFTPSSRPVTLPPDKSNQDFQVVASTGEMVFVPAGPFQMGCDPVHNGGILVQFNRAALAHRDSGCLPHR